MKPILFNTEMVRAILEGRKTVTRRVVKFMQGKNPNWTGYIKDGLTLYNGTNEPCNMPAPYKVNDILYVRETVWQKIGHYLDVDGETKGSYYNEFLYVATDKEPETGWNYSWVKRPSIHMPKEAARLFLRVTGVRVERLQDMTKEDMLKEGLVDECKNCKAPFGCDLCMYQDGVEDEFFHLWNNTIKKDQINTYGWYANPYVWVIEFERITPEQAEGEAAAVLGGKK